jgi:hypothetical protein
MAQSLDAFLNVTRRTVLEGGATAAVSFVGQPQFADRGSTLGKPAASASLTVEFGRQRASSRVDD